MKNLPLCILNAGNLLKIKPLQGGIYIPHLEGNIKKLLLQLKGRVGINSPLKLNILVMFLKLIKSFNNSKDNALGLFKKNSDSDYCDNPTESLNILLSKFFQGHASLSETDIRSRDDACMDWTVVKNN